jgi:hypothetical protein
MSGLIGLKNLLQKRKLNITTITILKIFREIGSGSHGKVCRANWKNSNSYLALKSFSNFNITAKENC